MWLPGHVSIAFLLCLPLLFVSIRRGSTVWLALAYVGVFSILPDFFHWGDYRMVSHSIVGLVVIAGVILYILGKLFKADAALLAIGAVAAGAHLAGDLWIGHIFPLFPFSEQIAELNQFNTLDDLRIEIVLSAIALVVLILFLYVTSRQWKSKREAPSLLEKVHELIIAAPFAAMCAGQLIIFGQMDLQNQPSITEIAMVPLIVGLLIASAFYTLSILRKKAHT
jgi:hypothetical protein